MACHFLFSSRRRSHEGKKTNSQRRCWQKTGGMARRCQCDWGRRIFDENVINEEKRRLTGQRQIHQALIRPQLQIFNQKCRATVSWNHQKCTPQSFPSTYRMATIWGFSSESVFQDHSSCNSIENCGFFWLDFWKTLNFFPRNFVSSSCFPCFYCIEIDSGNWERHFCTFLLLNY